jgi:hypothetical protein
VDISFEAAMLPFSDQLRTSLESHLHRKPLDAADPSSFEDIIIQGCSPPTRRTALALRIKQESQIQAFQRSLSDEDRLCFQQGRRLSPSDRRLRLAKLSPEQIQQRGLHFSDEPTSLSSKQLEVQRAAWHALPHTKLNCQAILAELWFCGDPLELDLLADTINHGANIQYYGPRDDGFIMNNWPNARQNPQILKEIFEKEIKLGFMAPFSNRPQFDNLRVVPSNLVQKSDGTWRPILDPSVAPEGHFPTNDHIEIGKEAWSSFDTLARTFVRIGRSGYAVVLDFKSAYRQIRARAQDLHLAGAHVNKKLFSYHARLAFGVRSSGFLWGRVPRTFLKIFAKMANLSEQDWLAFSLWVDDLIRLCPSLEVAFHTRRLFVLIAYLFGFELAPQKLVIAKTTAHVGITFSFSSMELSIRPAKRAKATALLSELLAANSWSKQQAQKLAGHYTHYGRILPALRPHATGIYAFTRRFSVSSRRLPPTVLGEVQLLSSVIRHWSGARPALSLTGELDNASPQETCVMDASPLHGFGFFSITTGEWAVSAWPPETKAAALVNSAISSTFLELATVPCLLVSLASRRSRRVLVLTDSKDLVDAARSRSSSSTKISALWRLVTLLQISLDIALRFEHRPRNSPMIKAADALSRGNTNLFFELARSSNTSVQPLPTPVAWEFLASMTPNLAEFY